MLAICAAMRWEVRPVLQVLQSVRRTGSGPAGVWAGRAHGQPVLVFRTGIGPTRAAAAARAVLDSFPVRSIVNTGCAGALVPGLAVGRLVIPSRLLGSDPRHEEQRTEGAMLSRLRHSAQRSNQGWDAGPLLTSPVPLTTKDAKQGAHAASSATAVEMEGLAVAREAHLRGVPFAAVRSILDTLVDDLPEPGPEGSSLSALRRGSRASSWPSGPGALMGLAGAARSVHAALRDFFAEILGDGSNPGG